MRESRERRRRLRSAAALIVLVVGVGSLGGGAAAQTGDDLVSQFGGYDLAAAGNGVVLTYDVVGAFPVSPIFSVGLPEAQARQTGGSGYALASLAYPGPLVADIGSALAQGGTETPIPPYPVRAQAFYPGDQTEQRRQSAPGADMEAITDQVSAEGRSRYSGADVPLVFDAGAVEVVARTELVEGQVVGRTRVHQSDVSLLGGLIRIESVVTDIVATSNGEAGATEGTTTVNGVTFLGLAAAIDGDGLHLTEAVPPPPNPTNQVTDPVTGPLGEALEPVVEGSEPVVDPISAGLRDLLATQGSVNEALLASGIQIAVLSPTETVEGPSASIVAGGLRVTMNYPGANDERFAQLLSLIPSDQLPSQGIPGAGLSPQAMVNLFKERHISNFVIASGSADVVASPAFEFEEGAFDAGGDFGSGGDFDSPGLVDGSFDPGAGEFETEVPSLPERALETGGGLIANGAAIPAALILITIFTSPMWAAASRRFADAALGGASAACPYGKDSAFSPPGSSSRAQ